MLGAGLASLAFWICLFAAAAMYGLVALSSKVVAWEALSTAHEGHQRRLVELEQQIGRVRRFIAAQRNDPEFLREQARTDFELHRPNEERIPVDSHLTLRIDAGPAEAASRPAPLPVYVPLIREIARSRRLSDLLLAAAASLVVGAFACFPVRKSTEETEYALRMPE